MKDFEGYEYGWANGFGNATGEGKGWGYADGSGEEDCTGTG